MEIFILEKLNITQTDMMKERVGLLEKQLGQLKDICTELYKMHCYYMWDVDEECKKKWDEARRCFDKIKSNEWNEAKDTLNLYKAQAFCYLGTAYKEQGDYDEAVKHLKKARDLVEELSARYLLPECYVRACMGLAKCYMEKHSHSYIIDECHACAKETIEEMGEKKRKISQAVFGTAIGGSDCPNRYKWNQCR